MPTATSEKLNQLRAQLHDCSNPIAAKLLKSTIAKLEAQLGTGQAQASKIDQRQAALRPSQKQAKQKASQQQRTTLKPPPPTNQESQPPKERPSSPRQDSSIAKPEETPKNKTRFSPDVFRVAKQLVLADELWNRPQVKGITIDGPTSRDLDDAIWIEATESGAVLSVHIADVSELVEMGSILDKVALSRTVTRYFSNGNAPMLPRPLSEDKLSLLEGKARPTVTVQVTLDPNAQMVDVKLFESWLVSQKRFTYAEASQPKSSTPFQNTLEMAHLWASHLYRNRLTSGSIGATQTAQGQWLTEEGSLIQGKLHPSHILIQEFMILANLAVAQWLADQDIPALYRNHTARAIAPDRETMYQTLLTLGSNAAIRQRLHSWMNRAVYSPVLIGHFALNLPAYCHFTSPIRRVADLINHRIVKARLKQQDLPYTQSELAELGQHIAQVKDEHKEQASEFFKAAHQKVYQEQLQTPEDLANLSGKEFTRLLKYAVESQGVDHLRSELVNRLDAEQLAVQDLYLLLFQSKELELHQQVIQYLSGHIHDAASVITIASNREGNWEAFKYLEAENKPPFHVWLEVNISGDSITTIRPATHSRKQPARHHACLMWLEAYLQNSLVTPEARVQPPLPEDQLSSKASAPSNNSAASLSKAMQTALMKPLSGGQNFVGMLLDVCQTLRWENPEYEMGSSDDWFICKCELDVLGERLEGSGVAKKKKLAKSLAAKEVLEQVRELAPQHWEEWFPGVAFSQPKNLTNQ
ncbi:ribonuclease catalytic domain-containing protein [Acaryochloris sp. CCMEE 5410]|uniref:ribonuclease catalytic domain-containing protein n=1 Tax=Acaryochloris sp. CCMEE 5410 TaxID=310037 RepID=UPI000248504A|nr:ribonuclease catalytic domain-containing protein [Acaryochloris sp. CCMEE 5410]KAI9129514.1 RNB domain-containing ribonuclease [Acaryochloris sp. CCMEE 5410]